MAILIANNGVRIVETIAERDAIVKRHAGLSVTVKDATADVAFGSGLVSYVWDTMVGNWLPTYSSYKPELKFSTEEKVITSGAITTDYVVKDGMVWSAKIIDNDGLIVADAQVSATGTSISLASNDYDGMKLHYTYAHGTLTADQFNIWQSKADNLSPTFTGTPTAPTAEAGNESQQLANTEFVSDALRSVGFEKETEGEGWKQQIKTDTYTVTVEPPAAVPGGTIDLEAKQIMIFNGTVNQNIVLSNPPGADRAMTVVIKFKGKGGSIVWPASIVWADDTIPELSDVFTVVILLWDGSEWIGSVSLKR